MLSSLPNLSPRDSYALWYTSTHHSSTPSIHQEPTAHAFDNSTPQTAQSHPRRSVQNASAHRTPLARLRADEIYMERRRTNVQNYGSSWIKPPGIFKSLHQLREERREMEEHQEALRREQLAQELAEAEGEMTDGLLQREGMDPEMEATRDLDDDVPEAETEVTGLDIDGEDEEDAADRPANNDNQVPRGVLAQRMNDDVFRETLVRGEEVMANDFGGDGGSDTNADDQSQMLQEEDLVHERGVATDDIHMGMDMDADLDDDVPEGDTGGYEHTDTEAELSSSDEDESVDVGQFPQGRALHVSMIRSDGTQNSMDFSGMDPRSGSSLAGSSPRESSDLPGSRRHRRS